MKSETSLAQAAPAERTLLDTLLHPRSIAIIGASTNPEALGGRPLGFLDAYEFAGEVYPVNPNSETVQGHRAYRSILDVEAPVDLALVVVRAALVPAVLQECADAGVGAAIVVSSGFGEGMGEGDQLTASVAEIVERTGLRVLGPNCEGVASLPDSAPVTFSPVLDIHRSGRRLEAGDIAVVSQSGGVGFAIAQWGAAVGLGFNYIVTTGNELDVDSVEIAEGLVEDDQVTAIVLVMEGVRDLGRFAALAARARDAGTRLVVAKMGRTEAGARGALAHTRHVTGPESDYEAIFEEFDVVQPRSMDELVDVLQAITKTRRAPGGDRVGIMTTSGGAGVWLADTFSAAGYSVPALSPGTSAALAEYMPRYGSPANPVDLTAQFLAGGSFATPLQALAESGEVDLVVLSTSLSSAGRLLGDKAALARLVAGSPVPIAIYSYTSPAPSSVEILNELRVPWYTDAVRAARGLAALIDGGARVRN